MAARAKKQAEREAEEQRLQDLETALALGLGHRLKALQKQWGLDARDFEQLIERAQANILAEAQKTSRFRRAAMLRKVQIAIQRAMEEKKYGYVAALVTREEQLSSGLGNVEWCEEVATKLGPVPERQEEALLFARRALLLNLPNILRDPSLSTKERTWLLNDTCAKLGITHDRAGIEDLADRLEGEKKKRDQAPKKIKPGQWKGRGHAPVDPEEPTSGSG